MLPLDGPSIQDVISVNSSTVVEVKVGSSAFDERKVVTLQPLNGNIYLYFGGDGAAPSSGTVSGDGFVLFRHAKESYEAGQAQKLYMLAVSGTVNVVVAERA